MQSTRKYCRNAYGKHFGTNADNEVKKRLIVLRRWDVDLKGCGKRCSDKQASNGSPGSGISKGIYRMIPPRSQKFSRNSTRSCINRRKRSVMISILQAMLKVLQLNQ